MEPEGLEAACGQEETGEWLGRPDVLLNTMVDFMNAASLGYIKFAFSFFISN